MIPWSDALEESSVVFVGLFKESLQLLLGGGLLLLHQVIVAFGDTPSIRFGHRGAEGTARGRLQLLPVVTTGPTERNKLNLTGRYFVSKQKDVEKKVASTWL